VLGAFHAAAGEVPAYADILREAGVDPASVDSLEEFRRRVPVIGKRETFGRFPIARLCRGGDVGDIRGVLTSSGHSGAFSFGLYTPEEAARESEVVDRALDALFAVRSRRTLLINALPMGVTVPTRACAVGQTSVRADMAVGQVAQFAPHFEQIILVGDAAFLKHVLELGRDRGIDWPNLLVQLVVGEEPLAENARDYLAGLLGCGGDDPRTGMIGSSMGVAELGLNLFFEFPDLIRLRRRLRSEASLREKLLGRGRPILPMVFTYDPNRVFVESLDDGRLVLSTLSDTRRVPLVRYATGDLALIPEPATVAEALGEKMAETPLAFVFGREKFLQTARGPIYPEQVKEGLYAAEDLAAATTANFRLNSADGGALVRVQLAPGREPTAELKERFTEALADYLAVPFSVEPTRYEGFVSGMGLDYERKFDYLGP
jgi:phenylacetate-CoA ligase